MILWRGLPHRINEIMSDDLKQIKFTFNHNGDEYNCEVNLPSTEFPRHIMELSEPIDPHAYRTYIGWRESNLLTRAIDKDDEYYAIELIIKVPILAFEILDRVGMSSIYFAIAKRRWKVANVLMNAGLGLNEEDRKFYFNWAIRGAIARYRSSLAVDSSQVRELIRRAVNSGADLDKLKLGEPPLSCAADLPIDSVKIMKLLIEYGADKHAENEYRSTAIRHAARTGTIYNLDYLLSLCDSSCSICRRQIKDALETRKVKERKFHVELLRKKLKQ